MKANEFVKKFGLEWAREVVKNQPETDAQIFNPYNQKYSSSYTIKKGVSVAHLKRLVESWELVEKHGGLEEASKVICNAYCGSNHSIPDGHEELSIAITDVESCQ